MRNVRIHAEHPLGFRPYIELSAELFNSIFHDIEAMPFSLSEEVLCIHFQPIIFHQQMIHTTLLRKRNTDKIGRSMTYRIRKGELSKSIMENHLLVLPGAIEIEAWLVA